MLFSLQQHYLTQLYYIARLNFPGITSKENTFWIFPRKVVVKLFIFIYFNLHSKVFFEIITFEQEQHSQFKHKKWH